MPGPYIDISRPLFPGMAVWPGDPATQFTRVSDMATGDACTVTRLSMCVHAATHLDAPSHFLPDGKDMTAMPLEAGIGEARVIGIENATAVTAAELKRHGIRRGERLLFRTANSERLAAPGPFAEDFTYVAEDAAKYLAQKKVRLVGVDYLSVGGFHVDGAATHRILLEAGIWLLEGLDLSGLSPGPVELICLPLRLVGAEGAPARAVARKLDTTVETERLVQYSSKILDLYIDFYQRYSLFRPLTNDNSIKNKHTKNSIHAFLLLRYILFTECVLRIANLCRDNSKGNPPSLENIIKDLKNNKDSLEIFKNRYSNCLISKRHDDNGDPEAEELFVSREQNLHCLEFDEKYSELNQSWDDIKNSSMFSLIMDIRNKVAAHSDIVAEAHNYRLSNISDFKIYYNEFDVFTRKIKTIVDLIQHIVRQSGFDYGSLDSFIEKNINGFWNK